MTDEEMKPTYNELHLEAMVDELIRLSPDIESKRKKILEIERLIPFVKRDLGVVTMTRHLCDTDGCTNEVNVRGKKCRDCMTNEEDRLSGRQRHYLGGVWKERKRNSEEPPRCPRCGRKAILLNGYWSCFRCNDIVEPEHSEEIKQCKTCHDTNLAHLLKDLRTGEIECFMCLLRENGSIECKNYVECA